MMRCWGIYLSIFVWANNSLLAIFGKGVDFQRLFYFYIIIKLNKMNAIPDYSIIKTCKHTLLCIGGAISFDRSYRLDNIYCFY